MYVKGGLDKSSYQYKPEALPQMAMMTALLDVSNTLLATSVPDGPGRRALSTFAEPCANASPRQALLARSAVLLQV